MDYRKFYDYVVEEEERLRMLNVDGNYRLCKALAACYELQDYLANEIAKLHEEDDDLTEWTTTEKETE